MTETQLRMILEQFHEWKNNASEPTFSRVTRAIAALEEIGLESLEARAERLVLTNFGCSLMEFRAGVRRFERRNPG